MFATSFVLVSFAMDASNRYNGSMDDQNEKKELLMHFALVGALALIHEWVYSDLRLLPEEMAEILDKMYHCIVDIG